MSFTLDGVASISPQNGVLTVVDVTITNNNSEDLYIRQYLSNLSFVKEVHLNKKSLKKIDSGIRKKMRGVNESDYFVIKAYGGTVNLKVPIKANQNGSKKIYFQKKAFYFDLTKSGNYIVILNDTIEGYAQKGSDMEIHFSVNPVHITI
jgi:hypothetical protein